MMMMMMMTLMRRSEKNATNQKVLRGVFIFKSSLQLYSTYIIMIIQKVYHWTLTENNDFC